MTQGGTVMRLVKFEAFRFGRQTEPYEIWVNPDQVVRVEPNYDENLTEIGFPEGGIQVGLPGDEVIRMLTQRDDE